MKIKDIIDWARRIQFLFAMAALLLSSSAATAVRALIYKTSIPVLWRLPIYFLTFAVALLACGFVGEWWSKRKKASVKAQTVDSAVKPTGEPAREKPAPAEREKRRHNVKFIEMRVRPMMVVACFQNVPIANKSLATFTGARLKIDYLRNDGQTFREVYPATWLDDEEPAINLEVGKSHYATVAVFTEGKWRACEAQTMDTSWGHAYEIEQYEIGTGKMIRAVITLVGNFGVSIEPVRLRLILHPDGIAEFTVERD